MKNAVIVIVMAVVMSMAVISSKASTISTHLPPPPTGIGNFVVGYMPKENVYRLGSTNYTGQFYISDEGVITRNNGAQIVFGDRYELQNGEWVLYSNDQTWISWFDSAELANVEGGKCIVFASNDFYGTQGQLLASKATDEILKNGLTLVGDSMSSSLILKSVLYPFKTLALVLIGLIVCAIALYKAFGFLKAQVKGA